MSRLFWVALGATAGVLIVRKVSKAARAYTPAGLAERAGGLGDRLRVFAEDVRYGMGEREAELRDALGIDEGLDLGPAEAASLVEHPARPRRDGR